MRAQYTAIEDSAAYQQFESMETKIVNSTGKLPVSFTTWNADTTDVSTPA